MSPLPEHVDADELIETPAEDADRVARYVAAGLLDPESVEVKDRLAVLEFLSERGATVERMAAADSESDLISLGLDLVLECGELSARELAGRVGISVAELVELYRLLGVDVADPEARWFEAAEVEFLEVLRSALCAFDNDTAQEILRVLSASLGSLAAASISAFVGSVEGDLEAAGNQLRRAEVTQGVGELSLDLAAGLRPLFRHHLRDAVVLQRLSADVAGDKRMSNLAVGFVDLVGFTSATSAMTAPELIAFTGRFRGRTYDVVTAFGGRVVKHIGDEIMFSALGAAQACRIALELIDSFDEGEAMPRGGVAYGPLVARHGDLYGPVVNLAARLAEIAVPGELLAPAAILGALGAGEDLRTEGAGRRALKGFPDPVAVVSVAREARGLRGQDAYSVPESP